MSSGELYGVVSFSGIYCGLLTVNILEFCTLKFLIKLLMQTVLTQIRLLLKEQSDLGLHCLPLH